MAFGKLLMFTLLVSFASCAIAARKRSSESKRFYVPFYNPHKFIGTWNVTGILMSPELGSLSEPVSCMQINVTQGKNNNFNITSNINHVAPLNIKNWTVKLFDNEINENDKREAGNPMQFLITDYNDHEAVLLDMGNKFVVVMSRNSSITNKFWSKYHTIFTGTHWSINPIAHNHCL